MKGFPYILWALTMGFMKNMRRTSRSQKEDTYPHILNPSPKPQVMDMCEADLEQLFEMFDVDGSGSIDAAEFVGPLRNWAHDSKTVPRLLKDRLLRKQQQEVG